MITLDIQGYCQECLDFEPDVERGKKEYIGWDLNGHDKFVITDTVVRCKYRNRCKAIKRYLEKEKQNAENSGDQSGVCGIGQSE